MKTPYFISTDECLASVSDHFISIQMGLWTALDRMCADLTRSLRAVEEREPSVIVVNRIPIHRLSSSYPCRGSDHVGLSDSL